MALLLSLHFIAQKFQPFSCIFRCFSVFRWVNSIRSHCVCDDMFHDCLKKLVDTPAAQLMGSIYFNIVQVLAVSFHVHILIDAFYIRYQYALFSRN